MTFFGGASDDDEDEGEDEGVNAMLSSCCLFKLLLSLASLIVAACRPASQVILASDPSTSYVSRRMGISHQPLLRTDPVILRVWIGVLR